MHNAWVIAVPRRQLDGFTVSLDHVADVRAIQRGDGLLLADNGIALAVGRVYRIKETTAGLTLYLDQLVHAADSASLLDLGVEAQADSGTARVEWDAFEQSVVRLTGKAFNALPNLSGKTKAEQAYVRELLRLAVVDDLLGPANGPHEIGRAHV